MGESSGLGDFAKGDYLRWVPFDRAKGISSSEEDMLAGRVRKKVSRTKGSCVS